MRKDFFQWSKKNQISALVPTALYFVSFDMKSHIICIPFCQHMPVPKNLKTWLGQVETMNAVVARKDVRSYKPQGRRVHPLKRKTAFDQKNLLFQKPFEVVKPAAADGL